MPRRAAVAARTLAVRYLPDRAVAGRGTSYRECRARKQVRASGSNSARRLRATCEVTDRISISTTRRRRPLRPRSRRGDAAVLRERRLQSELAPRRGAARACGRSIARARRVAHAARARGRARSSSRAAGPKRTTSRSSASRARSGAAGGTSSRRRSNTTRCCTRSTRCVTRAGTSPCSPVDSTRPGRSRAISLRRCARTRSSLR